MRRLRLALIAILVTLCAIAPHISRAEPAPTHHHASPGQHPAQDCDGCTGICVGCAVPATGAVPEAELARPISVVPIGALIDGVPRMATALDPPPPRRLA